MIRKKYTTGIKPKIITTFMAKKYKCVYYCCKNKDEDVKIIWVCIGHSQHEPETPFEPMCKRLTTCEVSNPDDCKKYIGMLRVDENLEPK
jgi:hypothetical protein